MKEFDITIVGLGPAGGTLANLLAMHGFSILILDKEGLDSINKGKCWSKEVIIEPGTMNRVREFYVRGERNRKYFFGVEEIGKMTYVSDNKNEVKDYIVRLKNGINESDESDF